MKRKIHFFLLSSILVVLIVCAVGPTAARPDDVEEDGGYEVWVIDQSNTKDEDGNGTLWLIDRDSSSLRCIEIDTDKPDGGPQVATEVAGRTHPARIPPFLPESLHASTLR